MMEFGENYESFLINFRKEIGLEENFNEKNMITKRTAICISGAYRTFDLCKYSLQYSILSQLENYDVFCLLSDENCNLEDEKRKIQEFFGDKLVFCKGFHELDKNIIDEEIRINEEYMIHCPHPNLKFNVKAQYRRYVLDKIKNSFFNYERTIITRFDIIFHDVVNLNVEDFEIFGVNDMFFIGRDFSNILEYISFNYIKISFDSNSNNNLTKFAPENHYIISMNKYGFQFKNKILCLRVREKSSDMTINVNNSFFIVKFFNINSFPKDFDWKNYVNINGFLIDNKFDALHHYSCFGIYENRPYKYDQVSEIPNDFYWKEYISFHPDIKHLNEFQAIGHFRVNGSKEKRRYKYDIPDDFNYEEYLFLNEDLSFSNIIDCRKHYFFYGKKEKRRYKYDIPNDFNWKIYVFFNDDLENFGETKAKIHYTIYGKKEGRRYK